MTTKTNESAQRRTLNRIVREQFDAFENQERLIRGRSEQPARRNSISQYKFQPGFVSTKNLSSKRAVVDSARDVDSFCWLAAIHQPPRTERTSVRF
jgi:hypothetical protein